MDKNLTKFHKKVKNLSPIKLNETKSKTNNQVKKEISKSDINEKSGIKNKSNKNSFIENELKQVQEVLKEKINSKEVNSNSKFEEHKYAKNINEYRHIMGESGAGDAQMAFVLDLRAYKKINYRGLKELRDTNPRFYSDEIENFKKKMSDGKEIDRKNMSSRENLNSFTHLYKKRLGATANLSQYGFETTLRNFRPEKNLDVNPEWKGASFIHKPRLFSSYLKSTINSDKWETKNKFFTMNSFNSTLKAYETVYDVKIFKTLKIFFIYLGGYCWK
jgi:hypothetical protein